MWVVVGVSFLCSYASAFLSVQSLRWQITFWLERKHRYNCICLLGVELVPCVCAVARLLFLKIDKDGDNLVSPAELQSWMRHIQHESMSTEASKQWAEISPKNPDLLTWDEYLQHTYKEDKGESCHCYALHPISPLPPA